EILAVLGEPIGLTGAADIDAIAAARLALDRTLGIAVTPAVEAWWRRWARAGRVDDQGRVVSGKEADLLFWAARAARLTRRAGSVDFKAGPSTFELSDAVGSAGIDYAVTGDAG